MTLPQVRSNIYFFLPELLLRSDIEELDQLRFKVVFTNKCMVIKRLFTGDWKMSDFI